MRCIGIDVGSSTIKGCVLNLTAQTVAHVHQRTFPSPLAGMPMGYFEISPTEVRNATLELLEQLFSKAPECRAIFWCGQMGGLVLVDNCGNPLSNYLSWRDQRTLQISDPQTATANFVDAIGERWSTTTLAELGNELQPGSASSLLYWLRENNQLPKSCSFATIADFVVGQLCQVKPAWDATQAIGLLNLATRSWHYDALQQIGIPFEMLPSLAPQTGHPKQWTPIGFLERFGREIPCFASIGDQPCALLGIGLQDNELSINVSTGSQVSMKTQEFIPGNYQSRCFVGTDYLNTITHLPAGRALNTLVDLVSEVSLRQGGQPSDAWRYILEAVGNCEQSDLRVSLSFFAGPVGKTGSISEITTENLSVGALFLAAFESMADNYQLCAKRISRDSEPVQLVLSGGLPRSIARLRQLIAARFPIPCRQFAEDEETLLGLLKIATLMFQS